MMRLLPIIGICLMLPFLGYGQVERLDSMKQLLKVQKGTDRLLTLLNLSYQAFDVNLEDAHQYALDALSEARALQNRPGEKHALTLIGEYYYNLSEREKAKKLLHESDAIRIKQGAELYTGYNYIIMANILLEESEKDSAQYFFKKAFALLEKTDNYKIKYYSYLCYAISLADDYKDTEAKELFEKLYVEAVKNHAVENQAEILIELANLAIKADDYQLAKSYLAKAEPLLPGPGYSYVRLIYFYRLGHLEYNMGNYFPAITHLREVLSAKEIEQYEDIKGNVMAVVGKIYRERGEFDLALKSDLDALKIFEKLDMKQDLGRVYGDISWIYFKQFNDLETFNFVNKAMEIGSMVQDNYGIAHAHSILGSLYTAQGKLKEGIREHEQALKIRKHIQSPAGISESYYNLGSAYEKTGQMDLALSYAQQSLELDKKIGNMYNLGLSNKKVGALYMQLGNYSLSRMYLEKADSSARKTSSLELRRDIDLLFADLYEKTGNMKMANQFLRTALSSNDSMYNVASMEKTTEIRALFDLENIEIRSKQREQELALQRIEMDSQNNFYLMAKVILLLVTLLLVIGAFLYNTSRKNNNKLLAEIGERKKAEAESLISQFKFEEAQALSHVGSWEFNLLSSALNWSKETFRIFELENHPIETLYGAWRSKIPVDDFSRLEKGIQHTINTGEPFNVEHRIICNDGSFKYVTCIGEAIKDGNGNIIGLRGTDQEITLQKQAALAKSEFLSNMSHEIRTPINGVIGISNLLMEEQLTDIQQGYVDTLKFSAQHLSSIVSDILDFSKIESGNLVFEKVPFNLKEVASNVFKLFETKAAEQHLQFIFLPDARINYRVSGDYVRLSQVLSNLISNAIKFTEKGTVALGYSLLEDAENTVRIAFTVRDTGIGITPQQTERIFDNFSQADVSINRRYGGTGLGLTISKKLVEQQDGTIRVESQPGQGSVFTVELVYDKYAEKPYLAPVVSTPATQTYDLKDMKILVAEDNNVNVLVLTPLLKRWGAHYNIALDGQEAIDRVEKEDYDVIIMDIQMPNVDGKEATNIIRQSLDEKKRNIPIIAFTAEASVEMNEELLHSGFNDCLTKPFQPDTLFNTLKKYHST